jgi:hypothetical protein
MKTYLNRAVVAVVIFVSAVAIADPIQIQPEDESEFVLLKRAEVKEVVNRLIEAQATFTELENVILVLQKKIEQLQKSTNCV